MEIVKLMANDKLLGDVVASIIEKVLRRMGGIAYTRVSEILADHSLKFSDCYQNPDVLNFALKELFGNAYLAAIKKIKAEINGLENDNQDLARFIQKLSE